MTVRRSMLVYIDDLLLAPALELNIARIFKSLHGEFDLMSLRAVRHFLGLENQREKGVFKIRL